MNITKDTTFRELLALPQVQGFREFLIGGCYVPDLDISLEEMQRQSYDWVADSIAFGVNRLLELLDAGTEVVWDIYSPEEKAADPSKENTKLFYFPGKPGAPYAVVCPGGGYNAICVLKEGFTTAAHLNNMGYHVFSLSYRIRENAVMPNPIDDLAAAIRRIDSRAEELAIDPKGYAVCGYSAGGHLAAEWGTKNCGYAAYGLERPAALLLGYPAVSMVRGDMPELGVPFLENIYGKGYTVDTVTKYSPALQIDGDYPAVYLWHCEDDPIVPISMSLDFAEKLSRVGVPYVLRRVEHGGHGFGTGEYSEAAGWMEAAERLWTEQRK